MPVSNPSYFPPNRATGSIVGITAGTTTTGSNNFLAMKDAGKNSTASNLLVIGNESCAQGLTAANIPNGLICLGNNSLNGANLSDKVFGKLGIICIGIGTAPTAAGDLGESTFIGNGILAAATLDPTGAAFNVSNTFIGHGILASFGADQNSVLDLNVLIGNTIMPGISAAASRVEGTVAIGDSACAGTLISVESCVFIGEQAAQFTGPNIGIASCIAIGSTAFAGAICGTSSRIVVIGDGAANVTSTTGNVDLVVVGSQSAASVVTGTAVTIVGSHSDSSPLGTNNVVIGDNVASIGNHRNGCITIGSGTPTPALPDTVDGQLYIGYNGTAQATGSGTAMWGIMGVGNLCLGVASAPQREFGGSGATNVLKLINGTAGNANPNGGGYFYVSNGALHWVGSNGTDTTLAQA